MPWESLAASCIALLAVAIAPAGSSPGAGQDKPLPVEIKVGATLNVCAIGQVVRPTMYPRCDDLNVAVPVVENLVENLGGGGWRLGLQGVGPGTTLWSVLSTTGARQVFSVSVR